MLNINSETKEKLDEKKEEILPNLLDQIFLICKQDDNNSFYNDIEKFEQKIEKLDKKLQEKNQLLEQSKDIENKLYNELQELDDKIFEKRTKILSLLGSDLWL